MEIVGFEIKNFGNIKHLFVPLDNDVLVIFGPNGSGKTRVLGALETSFKALINDDADAYHKVLFSFWEKNEHAINDGTSLGLVFQTSCLNKELQNYSGNWKLLDEKDENFSLNVSPVGLKKIFDEELRGFPLDEIRNWSTFLDVVVSSNYFTLRTKFVALSEKEKKDIGDGCFPFDLEKIWCPCFPPIDERKVITKKIVGDLCEKSKKLKKENKPLLKVLSRLLEDLEKTPAGSPVSIENILFEDSDKTEIDFLGRFESKMITSTTRAAETISSIEEAIQGRLNVLDYFCKLAELDIPCLLGFKVHYSGDLSRQSKLFRNFFELTPNSVENTHKPTSLLHESTAKILKEANGALEEYFGSRGQGEGYQIKIEPWVGDEPRLNCQVFLAEPILQDKLFPLKDVASGYQSMINICLALSISNFKRQTKLLSDYRWHLMSRLKTLDPIEKLKKLCEIIEYLGIEKAIKEKDHLGIQRKLFGQISNENVLLRENFNFIIIDEPETHLHPRLQQRFVGAVQEIASRQNISFILATHSPEFLRFSSPSIDYFYLKQDSKTGQIAGNMIEPSSIKKETEIAREFGLEYGHLWLFVNYILFVEGEHDKVFLEELFSEDLNSHRVLIIPIRGSDNAMNLVDSKIVEFADIPFGLLLDYYDCEFADKHSTKKSLEEALRDKNLSKKEDNTLRWLIKILMTFNEIGKKPDKLGLSKIDIGRYLDEESLRELCPSFTSWKDFDGKKAFNSKRWKDLFEEACGRPLDTELIRKVAKEMKKRRIFPSDLKGVITKVCDRVNKLPF